jgi:hypothetical protein
VRHQPGACEPFENRPAVLFGEPAGSRRFGTRQSVAIAKLHQEVLQPIDSIVQVVRVSHRQSDRGCLVDEQRICRAERMLFCAFLVRVGAGRVVAAGWVAVKDDADC